MMFKLSRLVVSLFFCSFFVHANDDVPPPTLLSLGPARIDAWLQSKLEHWKASASYQGKADAFADWVSRTNQSAIPLLDAYIYRYDSGASGVSSIDSVVENYVRILFSKKMHDNIITELINRIDELYFSDPDLEGFGGVFRFFFLEGAKIPKGDTNFGLVVEAFFDQKLLDELFESLYDAGEKHTVLSLLEDFAPKNAANYFMKTSKNKLAANILSDLIETDIEPGVLENEFSHITLSKRSRFVSNVLSHLDKEKAVQYIDNLLALDDEAVRARFYSILTNLFAEKAAKKPEIFDVLLSLDPDKLSDYFYVMHRRGYFSKSTVWVFFLDVVDRVEGEVDVEKKESLYEDIADLLKKVSFHDGAQDRVGMIGEVFSLLGVQIKRPDLARKLMVPLSFSDKVFAEKVVDKIWQPYKSSFPPDHYTPQEKINWKNEKKLIKALVGELDEVIVTISVPEGKYALSEDFLSKNPEDMNKEFWALRDKMIKDGVAVNNQGIINSWVRAVSAQGGDQGNLFRAYFFYFEQFNSGVEKRNTGFEGYARLLFSKEINNGQKMATGSVMSQVYSAVEKAPDAIQLLIYHGALIPKRQTQFSKILELFYILKQPFLGDESLDAVFELVMTINGSHVKGIIEDFNYKNALKYFSGSSSQKVKAEIKGVISDGINKILNNDSDSEQFKVYEALADYIYDAIEDVENISDIVLGLEWEPLSVLFFSMCRGKLNNTHSFENKSNMMRYFSDLIGSEAASSGGELPLKIGHVLIGMENFAAQVDENYVLRDFFIDFDKIYPVDQAQKLMEALALAEKEENKGENEEELRVAKKVVKEIQDTLNNSPLNDNPTPKQAEAWREYRASIKSLVKKLNETIAAVLGC